MEGDEPQRVKIDRPLYEQEQLHKDFEYEKPKKSFLDSAYSSCASCKPSRVLLKTIPVLEWLPCYKWRQDLLRDVIAGITVAIMHIPQGMAYSLLGNVPAVVGIYMAFFPVLIYFFLGTSKHNSMGIFSMTRAFLDLIGTKQEVRTFMIDRVLWEEIIVIKLTCKTYEIGTFAIVCLMTGKAVLEHSHPSHFSNQLLTNATTIVTEDKNHTPIEVATTVTFAVALFQLLMYVFRLGIVSTLLSETLVSGFTTGAAFQVLTSQMKDILGLRIPKHKGYFVVINTWKSIFEQIGDVNYVALIISSITIVVTAFNNEVLKPRVAKKCLFPIPIELIAVVIGTFVSQYWNMDKVYNISVVGHIPSGLPEATVPNFSLMGDIVVDALTIAIVSYAMSLSMALIFAQKLSYEVDANQELLAQGAGNIFGSFFSCMPFTASISRSLIQQTVGGKTQLTSLVSCGILVLVLMWIGPLFEPLPKSVLASVIVVALKGMLTQVTEFIRFWKLSKLDAFVWLITFIAVIFVSIDIGLFLGLLLSLATVVILSFKPYTCLLGAVPHADIYLDVTRYKMAVQVTGIKIFHYRGGINFASRNTFKSEICRLVGIQPQQELILRKKLAKMEADEELSATNASIHKLSNRLDKLRMKITTALKCLILDFSAVSYIDPSGVSTLKIIAEDFHRIDIPVYVAACSGPVYEMMKKCGLSDDKKNLIRIFPTVHDAVHSASTIFNVNTYSSISIIAK